MQGFTRSNWNKEIAQLFERFVPKQVVTVIIGNIEKILGNAMIFPLLLKALEITSKGTPFPIFPLKPFVERALAISIKFVESLDDLSNRNLYQLNGYMK